MAIDAPDYVTLSAMITPALFMTANGSLVISTSNRMSRVVDRIRVLNDLMDALARGTTTLDFPAERQMHLDDQLRRLERRGNLIRVSLILLYMALGTFLATSLAIGLDILLNHAVVMLPTSLAIIGVCLLFGASLGLVREALEALRSNHLEVRFFRELRRRRAHTAAASPPESPSSVDR